MAKDPAFLFYPGDWLGGTLGMTFEEKGAYFELLMLQFNRGHMTEHMIGQVVGQLWLNIKDKFDQDSDGLWYNQRLDEEKFKRKNFVSSRVNNKSGKNQYSPKGQEVGHMTTHMENENENTYLLIKEYDLSTCKLDKSSNGYLVMETSVRVYKGFVNEYPNNKDLNFITIKDWVKPIRFLIEKKKYTPEQIIAVAMFATTDKFWKNIILNTEKLEKNFEQLKLKLQDA